MNILQVAAGAFGLWVLLHWFVVPRLRRRLPKSPSARAIANVATLMVAEMLRSACFVTAVTFATVVAILMTVPRVLTGLSDQGLSGAFSAVRGVREVVESIESGWSIGFILLLATALVIALRREARRKVQSATAAALERLKTEAATDGLSPLPDTPEMAAWRAKLAAQRALRPTAEPSSRAKIDAMVAAMENHLRWLDVVRRLDFSPDFIALADTEVKDRSRLASFLVSVGFFRTLSAGSRALALSSLTLLPLALVAYAGPEIADTAKVTEARLHDLVIAHSIADAEKSWEAGLPPAPGKQVDLSPQDEQVVQQLSHQFARTAVDHLAQFHQFGERTEREVARLKARQRVLEVYAGQRTGLEVESAAARDQDVTVTTDAIARVDGPTIVEQRAQAVVRARMEHATPADRASFREHARNFLAQFSEPERPDEIAKMLFSESLNSAAASVTATTPASSAVQQFAAEFVQPGDVQERAAQLLQIDLFRFLDAAASGRGRPDLAYVRSVPVVDAHDARAFRSAAERMEAKLGTTVASWQGAPPTLAQATGDWPSGEDAVRNALSALARTDTPELDAAVPGWKRSLPDAMAQMPDYFPGHIGDETRTGRFRLAEAEPAFQGVVNAAEGALQTSFVRARSVELLRGFGRIGGILIGNAPEGNHSAAISKVVWTEGPDGIRLNLTRATDGALLSFGPFRAQILTAALAYAADGRPMTATMPLAGIFGREVMLHPALVDTALGCEARHLDQFADSFTYSDPRREEIEKRVTAHSAIYTIGWAIQTQRLAPEMKSRVDGDVASVMDEISHMADSILSTEGIKDSWVRLMRHADSWNDARLSPVTQEPAYFETDLVKDIGHCLHGTPGFDVFKTCLGSRPISIERKREGKWIVPPPKLRVETGVRQRSEPVDSELSFLDVSAPSRSVLWPLDFVVQVTFDSPPYLKGKDAPDPAPFEFDRDWVDGAVANGLDSPSGRELEARRVLADFREFTVLQELFRLAFSGGLGDAFPLNSLAELAAVKPQRQPERIQTLRWNVRPDRDPVLRSAGLGPALDSLGITRDEELAMNSRDQCPAILP